MTAAASLDIVIVSYNAREHLRTCLASLRDGLRWRPTSIVVVDNASADGSADIVTSIVPGAVVLRQSENMGFARANNVGIRQGRGDLILLLNSDTIVPARAVETMIDVLRSTAGAAAVGPRLVDAEGRVELSFGRMISPWNELRQKALGRLYARGFGPVARAVDRMTRLARRVDWVSGACLLVWRADAEAVGLLDERYFMYAEDVDFCAALRARGRQVLFTPAAEVIHARGRSREAAPEATRRAYRRSQLAFYAKHHPRWYPVLSWYLRLRREL